MNTLTVTAKTLEEAITKATIELGITSSDMGYDVIEKGSAGFLGFGSKNCVIKAYKKADMPVEEVKVEPVVEKKEAKVEVKKEVKTETKVEVKKEVKPKAKQEVKKEAKTDTKAEAKKDRNGGTVIPTGFLASFEIAFSPSIFSLPPPI